MATTEPHHRRNRWATQRLLLALIAMALADGATAFNANIARRCPAPSCPRSYASSTDLHMSTGLIATSAEPVKQIDGNGKDFVVGAVVRVCKPRKAFQVSKKGRGKFDEDKNFVPLSQEGGRDGNCLNVPPGLRGEVTRVYNTADISSNFPITVKFLKGEHTDEGYDPPVAFKMHFGSLEVEVV